MSSIDQSRVTSLDQARTHIGRKVFTDSLGGEEIGSVGLEPEYLVFRVDEEGRLWHIFYFNQ